MRLFVASPVIIDNYVSIKEDFKDIIDGKWVKEDHLHLTWIFLGNIEDTKLIIEKMQKLSNLENEVNITGLGYFGRPPKIFFAKAEEKLLYDKAKEFRNFDFDIYRFKPHITLCRINAIHDYKVYKEMLNTYKEKKLGIILPEISLYKSTLTKDGSLYERKFSI